MTTEPKESQMQYSAATAEAPSRPFSVTLLTVGVLTLAVLNFTRLFQTVTQWGFLAERLSPFLLVYLAISGLVWTVSGLLLSIGLWRGSFWAPAFTRLATLLYLVYFWLDRLLTRLFVPGFANWPFLLFVTLVAVFIVFWILSRRNVKAFFGETHDH